MAQVFLCVLLVVTTILIGGQGWEPHKQMVGLRRDYPISIWRDDSIYTKNLPGLPSLPYPSSNWRDDSIRTKNLPGLPGLPYPSMQMVPTVTQMPVYHYHHHELDPHHFSNRDLVFPEGGSPGGGFPGGVSPGGGFPGSVFPGGGFPIPGHISPGGGFPGSLLPGGVSPGGGYPGGGYPGSGYPGGGYPGGGYPGSVSPGGGFPGGGFPGGIRNPPYRDTMYPDLHTGIDPYFIAPPGMPGYLKLPTFPPVRVPQTSRPKFMPPTPFIPPERLPPENEDLSREVEVGFSSTSEEDLLSPAPPSLPTLDRLPAQLIPSRPKPAVKTVPATTHIPPTTVEPTAELPTTVAESMNEPATTEAASTPEPTTEAATTIEATTKAVTTAEPTTDAATTAEPTTDAATTAEPTTDAATTVKPTIAEPTTEKSINEQAKTEASTTTGCDDCTTEYRMTIGARYIGTKIVPWYGYN